MSEPGIEQDWSAKAVFSTGEAADVCNVSQQTIIRCFDKGRLQGFRVPGSKFRRIPRDELIRFMQENDIPLARIEGRRRSVLCLCSPDSVVTKLAEVVNPRDRLDVTVASSAFDAGWAACDRRPALVLIDGAFDACVTMSVLKKLAESAPGAAAPLVAVVGDAESAALARTLGSPIALQLDAGHAPEAIEQRIVALLDKAESA